MRNGRRLVGLCAIAVVLSALAVAYAAHLRAAPVADTELGSGTPRVQSTTGPTAPTAEAAIEHVLAISIDGLNPTAISRLGPRRAPTFHRLMREGSSTLNARTTWEATTTLPNHTSMLTGRAVDRRHGGHGWAVNSDRGGTVHEESGRYVPSIFDLVHDRGGRTALYTSKTKFAVYPRSWNTHGAADRIAPDNGRAKIDQYTLGTDARLVSRLNAQLARAPAQFTFLHLSRPDRTGHAAQFMSGPYLDAVSQTDRLVGTVLDTISSRPSLRAHTLVLLTADHSGSGRSHGNPRHRSNFQIAFMAWGSGVPAGQDLYAANGAVRDPGGSRPGYQGPQPIRNGDLANVAADALDLPPVPGSTLNARDEWDAFG